MFISWIKLLYTNISSSVIVNGHIGLEFPVKRSVRQGCAISPLLYVLSMEPFAHRIRREPGFCGLQMPGTPEQVRISLYADDTTLVVTNENSISLTFSICREFGLASGAKLNMDKTCGIWLGRWKDREDSPYGIKWVKSKKLLGFCFGYGEIFTDNWSIVKEKFRQALGMHSMRNLSMRGRAVMCNVMATSKLTYVGQFLHLPEQFLKLINSELFRFIYGRQHESIKRETLYGDPSVGGIGLVCIKLKLRAFLIMHIVRLLTYREEYFPKWVHFAIYWIGLHYREFCPDFASNMRLHSMEYTPRFYKQCQLLFDDYIKEFGTNVNLKSLSLKIIYENLLTKVFIPPKIVAKFPEKDFGPVWPAVNNKFLDPEIKSCIYKMAHNVLPTNFKLFMQGQPQVSDCTFCGKKFVETPKHLFAECRQAAPVWFFVKSIFWKLCNHRLKVDEDLVMFSLLPKLPVDKALQDVLFYLTCLARYSIWIVRCKVKKEFRSFSGDSSLEDFKKKLKFRILVDSQRYKNDRRIFLQSWAIDDVLCSIDAQGGLTYHF